MMLFCRLEIGHEGEHEVDAGNLGVLRYPTDPERPNFHLAHA